MIIERVTVNLKIKQEKGKHFLVGSYIEDGHTKIQDPDIRNFPSDVIEFREKALIEGLINCMYLAEKSGYRKTNESLVLYMEELKRKFAMPCIQMKLKDVKDIQK